MTKPNDRPEVRLTPEECKRLEQRFEEKYRFESAMPLTNEEARSLAQKFEAIGREFEDMADFFDTRIRERVRQLAGIHWDALLHSSQCAEDYLQSSEPSWRQAALWVLYHHWGHGEAYAGKSATIATSDPSADVRAEAFMLLGFCYSHKGDRRISRMLAKVVLNGTDPDIVRRAAYYALLRSHGRMEVRTALLEFPDQVNWSFVEGCSLENG